MTTFQSLTTLHLGNTITRVARQYRGSSLPKFLRLFLLEGKESWNKKEAEGIRTKIDLPYSIVAEAIL